MDLPNGRGRSITQQFALPDHAGQYCAIVSFGTARRARWVDRVSGKVATISLPASEAVRPRANVTEP
jgi:hypothetical protein